MAYVDPTAADVVARFPEFAGVPTTKIDLCIADAKRDVDESWIEADYKGAIIELTCHLLVSEGALAKPGQPSPTTVGPLTSESMGDASKSYAMRNSLSTGLGAEDAELAMTTYGQRFMKRRNNNFPAVGII